MDCNCTINFSHHCISPLIVALVCLGFICAHVPFEDAFKEVNSHVHVSPTLEFHLLLFVTQSLITAEVRHLLFI